MSPLFGGHKDGVPSDEDVAAAAADAEIARLAALPLQQLAAEVMDKGFGPNCPASDGFVTVGMLVEQFVENAARYGDVQDRLKLLVGEGVQALEHASLVCPHVWASHPGFYVETRYGKTVREANAVERVLSGGSL
jgi:hypothetical protein